MLEVTTTTIPAGTNIFASTKRGTYQQAKITVVSGAGNLKAGTCLGKVTSSGKYKKWDNRASGFAETGEAVLVGVLVHDIDATSEDKTAYIYINGDFNLSALTAYETIAAPVFTSSGINIIGEQA